MAVRSETASVIRQRFPRGVARAEKIVGAPSRGLDSVGHVAWFVVTAVGGDSPDRLVSEFEDFEGTTTVQDGTTYLVIEASGDWEITKK